MKRYLKQINKLRDRNVIINSSINHPPFKNTNYSIMIASIDRSNTVKFNCNNTIHTPDLLGYEMSDIVNVLEELGATNIRPHHEP